MIPATTGTSCSTGKEGQHGGLWGLQTLTTHSLKPTSAKTCVYFLWGWGKAEGTVKVSRAEITAGEKCALPSPILWPAWPTSQTFPVNTLQPQPNSAFPKPSSSTAPLAVCPRLQLHSQLCGGGPVVLEDMAYPASIPQVDPSPAHSGTDSVGLKKMNLSLDPSSVPNSVG